MKNIFIVTLAFAVLVAFSCAVTKSAGTSSLYKNLKVLPQDISAKQIDSVMHHYTASLNVKCNFCHVRTADNKEWDWASDANKHKLVAREMITMTNEINAKYLNHTGSPITLTSQLAVTCYTCHNGAKEPATKAPQSSRP